MKNTYLLVSLCVVLTVVLALVLGYQLESYQKDLQRETARLIGREVAAAISEPTLERLMQGDAATRQQIRSIISAVTGRSDLVTSISVVNRQGKVVASDELAIGRQMRRPSRLFGGDSVRFFTLSSDALRGDHFVMAVPVVSRQDTLGYLRILLDGRRIVATNRGRLFQLLLISLLGLVCVVGLASFFQARLERRVRDLVQALDAAGRGETPASQGKERDEFSPLLEAAIRVGRTLQTERASASAGRMRFDVLARALDAGLILLMPDGTLEFANDRALALFGAADLAALEAALAESQPRLDEALERLPTRPGAPVSIEVEVPVEGRRRALRLDLYGRSEQGYDGTLVWVRDRAALRALETDLRLAAHLRGMSRVYLAIAHDIRAPLNAMILNLELLGRSLDGASEPDRRSRQERYLGTLRKEFHRLHRMLETLLSHTRVSTETVEVFDLREVIHDLEALLEPYCRANHVHVTIALPKEPTTAYGSRDAIKQALLNVLINALDAMPQGGELNVTLEAGESTATIAVSDTGGGIAPEVSERLFTMHATTKESGTGIGLYVARSVVDAHGGQIRVQSESGRGTRFEVELPLSKRRT